MLLTEKEAKEKWCPHVRIAVLAGHGGAACNTHPDRDIEADCRCVSSRCAMWRWADAPTCQRVQQAHDMHATTEPERPAHVPQSWVFDPYDAEDADCYARWVEPKDEAAARRRGYCGLAGKPEEA